MASGDVVAAPAHASEANALAAAFASVGTAAGGGDP